MELSLLLAQQIGSMIIMILMGFAAVKAHLFDTESSKVLSAMSLYLLAPCMIFSALQIEYSPERLKGILIGMLIAVGAHFVFIMIMKLSGKLMSLSDVEKGAAIYSNCGNLLIPIAGAVMGQEYVFYVCAYNAVMTVMMWTHLISLIEGRPTANVKKIITNPNILAMIAGFVFFLLPVSMPGILQTTIDRVGATIGPVSMFGIGILMSQYRVREIFANKKALRASLYRLLILPLILIALLWISHITLISDTVEKAAFAVILAACAPVAVSVPQMASIRGKDAGSGSVAVVLSTLMCIITMPVIVMIWQLVMP